MLTQAGEHGLRHVSVRSVLEDCGSYRSQFYLHFTDKQDCFVLAYQDEIYRLSQRLLGVIEADEPVRTRCETALSMLSDLVAEEPALAKALFIEVHVAGEAALATRREVVERLSRAIDRTCRENESRHSPPPMTAEFIVGAVDQAISSALVREAPEELRNAVEELSIVLSEMLRPVRS